MTTETKFRIWNGKRMVYDGGLMIKGNTILIQDKGKQNLSIPMQFTGLKDKNGIDIYDKFIILYNNKPYLVYKCQSGEWRARNKGENLSVFDISNKSDVIGNIYENPEILKDKTEPEKVRK